MDRFELLCTRAVVDAATLLEVDPEQLAHALQNGRIAQLIVEARIAAEPQPAGEAPRRDRRQRLLRLLDGLPDASADGSGSSGRANR